MKKSLIIYYALLLGLLSTWNSPELPPMSLRLIFLVLSVAPAILSKSVFFPCILSTFVIISANRFVPSYMPFLPEYLVITTIFVMMFRRFKRGNITPIPLIVLLLFSCFINLFRSMSIESLSITALNVVLFYTFVDADVQSISRQISISLVIVSLFLCVETLIFKDESVYTFTVGYMEYERVGWNDPNYFSSIIGMGALASLNMLVAPERLTKLHKALLSGIVMLVIFVSLMIASRGAILAMFISSAVLLISTRRLSRNSMWLVLVLLIFLAILYQVGSFDFLISRFVNDEGEIGGRSIIWRSKLADFASQASLIDWLIGFGHKGGLALSSYVGDRAYIGFHNDYIALLVSYGVIGVIIVIAMYLYPIIKYKDSRVTSCCLYVMLISLSLEPLYSGGLAIFYFYFYVCVIGEETRQSKLLVSKSTNTKNYMYDHV